MAASIDKGISTSCNAFTFHPSEMGKAGTLSKLRKTHWEGAPPEPGAGVTPLEVENVGGMFVMLFAGTALGCVIGIIEFFAGVCREKADDETLCEKMGQDCKLATSCASKEE